MLLRFLRLHGVLDQGLYLRDCQRHRKRNILFRQRHPDFAVPPTQLAFDAYHTVSYDHYFNMGLAQAQYFMDVLKPHLQDSSNINLLDWGCGPGRIIRHMGSADAWTGKIHGYGVDYNADTIAWCRENIPNIEFSKNELTPPLTFDADFFDLIIVRSVFTHLSEAMHEAWIDELCRVLKPGGLLLATLHGRNFLPKMTEKERFAFEKGKLVVRDGVKEGKKGFTAFHPESYLQRLFTPAFKILNHIDQPQCKGLLQDVWLIQKTEVC